MFSSFVPPCNLSYQLEFNDAWAVASVQVTTSGGEQRLTGLHANPLGESLKSRNAFTFSGKSFAHYAVVAFVLAVPALILAALTMCVRTPLLRRKWLWIVFILFGVGQLSFNWTTGQFGFNPLSFSVHLFAVGMGKGGPYAPWIFTLSLPLGAIIFLVRHLRGLPGSMLPPPLPAATPVPPPLGTVRESPSADPQPVRESSLPFH